MGKSPQPAKPDGPKPSGSTSSASGKTPAKSAPAAKKPAAEESLAHSLFDEELPELPNLSELSPLGSPLPELPSLDSPFPEVSPLDSLLDSPSLMAEAATAEPLQPTLTSRAPVDKRTIWIAIGAAGAAALLLLVVVIYLAVRSDGSELLSAADASYEAAQYSEALAAYDQYLASYASQPAAEAARLRRGVAAINVAAQGRQWLTAYETAVEVLDAAPPGLATEAPQRLVGPLVAIVRGLAAEARLRPEPATVEKGLDLLRRAQWLLADVDLDSYRLDSVERSLGQTGYELQRAADRDAALAALRTAESKGDLANFHQVRDELLRRYPELRDDAAILSIAASMAQAQPPRPVRAEKAVDLQPPAPAPQSATITLARRQRPAAPLPGVEGAVLIVSYQGAAYGIRASDGEVLWRRFVGCRFDGTSIPPVAVAEAVGSDVLLVDQSNKLLLRVDATNGQPRWSLPLEHQAAGPPQVVGDHAWIACGPVLRKVAVASGESFEHVVLPQPAATAPAVDPGRGLLFLPAERLEMYVLGLDGACQQVLTLGHEAGSIRVPPLVLDGHLVAAVNTGMRRSRLHAMTLAAAPQQPPQPAQPQQPTQPWLRLGQEMPLPGPVTRPLSADGQRLVVATDGGGVLLFSSQPGEKKSLLRLVGQWPPKEAATPSSSAWAALVGENLWLAERQLTRLTLTANGLRDPQPLAAGVSGPLVEPPRVIGETLFAVQSQEPFGGCVVTAVSTAGQPLWQTTFAVPLAGPPLLDHEAGKGYAVTNCGDVYAVDLSTTAAAVLDQPLVETESAPSKPLTDAVRLDTATIVAAARDDHRVIVYDLASKRSFAVTMPAPLAAAPRVSESGIVLPCPQGQAFRLEVRRGQPHLVSAPPPEGRDDDGVNLPADDVALPPAGEPLARVVPVSDECWLAVGFDGGIHVMKKP